MAQQLEYPTSLDRGIHGDIASTRPVVKRARVYPKKKKVVAVSLGGTNNGTYTVRIETPEGDLPLLPFDSSFVASGSSADDIVSGLVDQINRAASAPNLRGVVRAVADLPNDDIIITADHAGKDFTVSFPSNPNSNLSQSTTQEASVANLPIGVGMVDAADGLECALPGSSTVADRFFGLVARGRGIEGQDDGSAEFHQAGDNIDIVVEADMFIMPEDDVTVDSDVYWKVEATAGTLGALRGSVQGSTQVMTVTPTVDHNNYAFEYGYLGRHYVVQYSPTDGTTTVADACAGLEDAADDGNDAGVAVSAGGTTAITLTAAAGTKFDYARNAAWSLDTEAASTTVALASADEDAVKLPRYRAKWIRGGGPTSGQCAVLALNE